jgi:phenylalanyl-tRNA synthetase alpha chain
LDKDEVAGRDTPKFEDKSKLSISSLHPIEKKLLSVLRLVDADWVTESDLVKNSELTVDQVRRGVEWLRYKDLVQISEDTEFKVFLHPDMSDNEHLVLPERKFVNIVNKGVNKLSEIIDSQEFRGNDKEVFGAIRFCKKNNWISILDDKVTLLPDSHKSSSEENFMTKFRNTKTVLESLFDNEDKKAYDSLKKRRNILITEKLVAKKYRITQTSITLVDSLLITGDNVVRKMTQDVLVSGKWRDLIFEQIDVEAPLPLINYGKKNPLVDFIDEVKEILIGMGFSEIEGNLTQSCFWNFDALFIPQDHPAREMQDTFYLRSQTDLYSPLPKNVSLLEHVSKIHRENWQYDWNIEESKPYVLRTHTTPVTLQYLSEGKPERDKVFLIGRVFRNEKVTFKHLVEFHQVEGIYVNKDANLRQLIGIQSEFYSKLGIKRIKFWPTFFPYTEPSLQSMVYNEKFDKWIELFGMGIFRPEVTRPLGIKNPVLAWGGGFERLAMLRFDLDDIRELYSNNLTWLKGVPKCL